MAKKKPSVGPKKSRRWVIDYRNHTFREADVDSAAFLVTCESLRSAELPGPLDRWSADDPTHGPSALAAVIAAFVATVEQRAPLDVLGEVLCLTKQQLLDCLDFELVEVAA